MVGKSRELLTHTCLWIACIWLVWIIAASGAGWESGVAWAPSPLTIHSVRRSGAK